MTSEPYIPALRFKALTRFYDPVLAYLLRERAWKAQLVRQTALTQGMRVLDLGCGTGTLTMMLAQACSSAAVVGLDADAEALDRARQKASVQADLRVEFVAGMAHEPPFARGSFDRIVSSLLFHHLSTDHKLKTLSAARALLRPGGELHLADWGEPHDRVMRAAFLGVQLLDGFETTGDNVRGRLSLLIERAGFEQIEVTRRRRTVFGSLSLLRARAPAS